MNRPTLLILALVALLVIATSWLSQKSGEPAALPPAEAAKGVADYFIRGFEGTVTASNGAPSHRLKADYLVHYAGSDITEMEQPHLTVYRKPGEQWQVQARHGRMEGEGEQVLLRGKVVLTQRSTQQPLQLRTDELLLYPERHYAETDSAVDIRAPGGRVQGVGMKVFGEEDRLLLLSDTRGTYDATAR